MHNFIKFLRADILKVKRQATILIHLLVPIVGIVIFLLYYSFSPLASVQKVAGFLETLAVAFPTLIGIVCSMAAEQECSAGNFQQLLTSPIKIMPFMSKMVMLLILGFGAVLLAAAGFGIGFICILHNSSLNFSLYIYSACILFCSVIFLYILHLVISLRFGRGASIGVGVVESLLSALLLTGLGYGIWQFIPCAWGARFISIFAQDWIELGNASKAVSELHLGILFCIVETIIIIALACIWFLQWEGRGSEE